MDNVIIFLIILLVLFLIGRELVCWYFKINQTVSLLEEIRDTLKRADITTPNNSETLVDEKQENSQAEVTTNGKFDWTKQI